MTEIAGLVTRIARAKRFAAAMTNDAEKKRFAVIAMELEGRIVAMPKHPRPKLPDTDGEP